MGKNALSGFLKSLCENSCWIYAIFWKLQHENQMFLSWEDWYCDYPKVRALTGNSRVELFTDVNQFLSFDDGGGIIDGTASQIAFAVARTSCLKYKLGEGIIGEVVCTENHCWVSLDDVLAIHCKSDTPFNIPDEWLPQISAGIKTILVLPLLPYGVLQLGSDEKVPEIKEAVNHIKSMFSSTGYEQARYAHLTPNKNPTHSLSSVMSFLLDNMDGSSLIDSTYVSGMQFEGPENGAEANRDRATTCQVVDQLEDLQEADDSETLVLPKGLHEISNLLSQPANTNHRDMVDHNDLWFSGMAEDLLVFSKSHNLGMSAEFSHGLSDSCTANDTSKWSLKSTDADHANHGPTSNMFNFPKDCELHKALGPSFQGRAIETSVLFENAFSDSQMSHNVDSFYDVERSAEYLSQDDAEFLLEAVIPNRYGSSQSPSPVESNITKLSVLSRQSDTSSNTLNILEGRTSDENVSAVVIHRKDRVSVPSSPVSMKSTTRSFKREQWHEEDAPALARKGEKLLSGYKRRSRRGDNKKPRPRDRQLIQERLHELRILVPSSMKCSIDSLLERTIKHMLFLRRVTHQAEKLTKMETFEQKVVPQDNKNKWEYVPGHGRTNLAVQGGGEFQACPAPIAVEDLNQPGHMLIKVICNEQGLFLEIAQVITRLELTIVKGIFENHSNDTWACFIVEASKDFQKMDIFWPLMQLLRCTRARVSRKI